ncbi:MAG: site-specific integrase [Muribaculaceae bacterium]|nr:site-specific integrase [Muribaculaceae bacterium]
MSTTSISVVCYKWKTLSNGENPLMLYICKDRKRQYRSLGISVNPKYWNFSKNMPKSNCPDRDQLIKIIINKKAEIQSKILELNANQKDFTASSLLNGEDKKFQVKTVGEFYLELIEEYKSQGKCGNRLIYKGSYNSLKVFNKGKLNIPFSDMDIAWLSKYEKWLRKKGNKETTISLLFRTLRSAYNKAIQAKCARKSDYPFDDYKINKFDTTTQKRAISKSFIFEIKDSNPTYESKSEYKELSKDIFIFSYLCGGMNFTDIANLTKDNIVNGRIRYIRQKTGKIISIGLIEEAEAIISKYESHSNGYLFPILDKSIHKTPQQKQNRIHKILVKVNSNLKELAKQLGIEGNLTTYVARHSFASILKKSGTNIALISEALGHSDITTTQIYLDSFDNEQIDDAMKNLL